MIAIPASLRSDFIHIPGTLIHIALESTIHITGIGTFGVDDNSFLPRQDSSRSTFRAPITLEEHKG